MKSTYLIGGLASMLLLNVSCADNFDYKEVDEAIDYDYISGKWDRAQGFVSKIYDLLTEEVDLGKVYEGAMLSSATDESVYSHAGHKIENFYNGAWSPSNGMSGAWKSYWQGVSYCNMFLADFADLDFEKWKMDKKYPQALYRYKNFKYEVRWARAYFYFCLVRQYGDVPLYTENLNAEEVNSLPRTPAEQVLEFIDKELAEITPLIIKDYGKLGLLSYTDATENGRVTDLGCMALRARAALYHASPLFNKSGDASLWQKAKELNKAVIDSCEARVYTGSTKMSLHANYQELFINSNWQWFDENIFVTRGRTKSKLGVEVEKYNFPVPMTNAGGGNCPSESLVEAYEEGDARLAATVAMTGEHWPNNLGADSVVLETYVGGANGPGVQYATTTGYYLKKYQDPAQVLSGSSASDLLHHWVVFRLAEFYLNYAECCLETGDAAAALPYINKIRKRAKLKNLDELTVDNYRRERFVELAFEGHRFFDVRRWKEGPKYFTSVKRAVFRKEADGTISKEVVTDSRVWDDKYYFFPIPQSDMNRNEAGWSQNPGW